MRRLDYKRFGSLTTRPVRLLIGPQLCTGTGHLGALRKLLEKRLVDKMIEAYIDWRDAWRAVNDAYRGWARAPGVGASVAFTQFAEALDTEESAAEVSACLVRGVSRLVASDNDLSGLLG